MASLSPFPVFPFHLAIPVDSIAGAAPFYEQTLGCTRGRSSERWIDYNFFGHQLVIHQVADEGKSGGARGTNPHDSNPVDGDAVPVPHFGVVLPWNEFDELAERLRAAGVAFEIEPRIRFAGQPGEQKTMFVRDPSDNALEFKSFRDRDQLFAS